MTDREQELETQLKAAMDCLAYYHALSETSDETTDTVEHHEIAVKYSLLLSLEKIDS